MAYPTPYRPAPETSGCIERDNGIVVIPMCAAAVSGCGVGLVLSGGLVAAGLLFAVAVLCCLMGWWARGLK